MPQSNCGLLFSWKPTCLMRALQSSLRACEQSKICVSWVFSFFWLVNFQSPTQKKIMYVRESSRDATVQLWVVIFMSAYLPDAGFTKFAAGLWTIKDLCKFLVYLLQWTYSLRGYVIYSEALNFIHLQFHEIFSRFLIFIDFKRF